MKNKTIILSREQLKEVLQKMIKKAIIDSPYLGQLDKTGKKTSAERWTSKPSTIGTDPTINAPPSSEPIKIEPDKTMPGTPGSKGTPRAPMVAPTGPSSIPTTQEPQPTKAMALQGLQDASEEQIKAIMAILNPQSRPQE